MSIPESTPTLLLSDVAQRSTQPPAQTSLCVVDPPPSPGFHLYVKGAMTLREQLYFVMCKCVCVCVYGTSRGRQRGGQARAPTIPNFARVRDGPHEMKQVDRTLDTEAGWRVPSRGLKGTGQADTLEIPLSHGSSGSMEPSSWLSSGGPHLMPIALGHALGV